jgi:hypothetical protein
MYTYIHTYIHPKQLSQERARSTALMEAMQKLREIATIHENCGQERSILIRKMEDAALIEKQLRAKVLQQAQVRVYVCISMYMHVYICISMNVHLCMCLCIVARSRRIDFDPKSVRSCIE